MGYINESISGLHTVIERVLQPRLQSDLSLAADFCTHWLLQLQDSLTNDVSFRIYFHSALYRNNLNYSANGLRIAVGVIHGSIRPANLLRHSRLVKFAQNPCVLGKYIEYHSRSPPLWISFRTITRTSPQPSVLKSSTSVTRNTRSPVKRTDGGTCATWARRPRASA